MKRSGRSVAKILLAVAIIAAAVVGLLYAFCSPLDVTDNPARNGGYARGAIFVTKVPLTFLNDSDPGFLELEGASGRLAPVAVRIPPGTRVRILKVTLIRTVTLDNVPRSDPIAEFVDGPCAGAKVSLSNMSVRTPDRLAAVNPEILTTQPSP